MSLSSLNSIGQSFFELESGNENVDGQTDVIHINLKKIKPTTSPLQMTQKTRIASTRNNIKKLKSVKCQLVCQTFQISEHVLGILKRTESGTASEYQLRFCTV